MKEDLASLNITLLDMEIISATSGKKTFSFRTENAYFALTDVEQPPEDNSTTYYDVVDALYEDESLSLHFDNDARFLDEYHIVVLNGPMHKDIVDFVAGYLFFGNTLKLALKPDGRSRLQ